MDYGLLTALSEGVKSGMDSYRTERDYQLKKKQTSDEQALKEKMFKASMAEKGLLEDQEKGFIRSPELKKERALEQATKQAGLIRSGFEAEYNPETEEAQLKPIRGYKTPEQRAAEVEASKLKQQQSQAATELRKEYIGLPTTKATQEVASAYEKVKSAAQNPSAAGDLSLIFGYMKMLDPGSTVREGEFANAQNSAGIPDQIRNMYNKAISGERLNDVQREDFVNQAGAIYSAQLKSQGNIQKQYEALAGRQGVNAKDVILPFEPAQGLLKKKSMAKDTPRFEEMSDDELRAYLGQ